MASVLRRYRKTIGTENVDGFAYEEEFAAPVEEHDPDTIGGPGDPLVYPPADGGTQLSAAGLTMFASDGTTKIFELSNSDQSVLATFPGLSGEKMVIQAAKTDIEFYNSAGNRRGAILYQNTDQLNILGGDGTHRSRIDVKSDRVVFRLRGTDDDGTNGTFAELVNNGTQLLLNGVSRIPSLVMGQEYDVTFNASANVSNDTNVTFGLGAKPTGAIVGSAPLTAASAFPLKTLFSIFNITSTGGTVRGRTVDGTSQSSSWAARFGLVATRG